MRTVAFLVEMFRRYPLRFLGNAALLVAQGLVDAVSMVSLVPVVDLLINPGLEGGASPLTRQLMAGLASFGFPVGLWSLLGVFLALNVLKSGFSIFAGYSIMRTKYAVIRDLMVGTFTDFFRARWRFFSSAKQGTLLNTFIRELVVVSEAFGVMAQIVAHSIQLAFYLVVPFYLSWQVSSVSLGTALLCAVPFMLLGRVSYQLGKVNTSTANDMGAVIQESLSSAKVILGFGNQQKSIDALGRSFDGHRKAAVKSQTLRTAIPQLYYPLGLVVLGVALLASRRWGVPLAETAVVLYALLRLVPTVGSLLGVKSALENFYPSYEQVCRLREQAQALRQRSGTRRFAGFREITTESLGFAHPGHPATLADVAVRIPRGQMIALVGESGSGKSTLIDLLMGFHQPQRGQILIDGVPLHEFDMEFYRRRIGYVPQESLLFHGTIRENLLWADEGAQQEDIARACRQANAEGFIGALPKGYDTVVGDRGMRLSGGQVQRVALARAILRKPELLILDEATSSLDSASERLIQQAMEDIAKETTVVVIAHRLSTIMNADYVYVLKRGRVVEEGTYVQLVQRVGEFYRMARLQALEATEVGEAVPVTEGR